MEAILTPSESQAVHVSKKGRWVGRALSALAVLFLLFDSVIKLVKIGPVVDSFTRLGYPDHLARGIGALELACIAVYLVPRASVLGASSSRSMSASFCGRGS